MTRRELLHEELERAERLGQIRSYYGWAPGEGRGRRWSVELPGSLDRTFTTREAEALVMGLQAARSAAGTELRLTLYEGPQGWYVSRGEGRSPAAAERQRVTPYYPVRAHAVQVLADKAEEYGEEASPSNQLQAEQAELADVLEEFSWAAGLSTEELAAELATRLRRRRGGGRN